jgi:predicted nucleic acid-binding protein
MLLVVADTSPIRYLVQIDQIELLTRLFQKILIPSIVADELGHPSAPAAVRTWIKAPPAWLDVVTAPESNDPALNTLDPGEKAALALGVSQRAGLILIDERKAAAVALKKGFETTGTLGVLDLAARRGLIDLKVVLDRLKGTNFRYRQAILDALLRQQEGEQR